MAKLIGNAGTEPSAFITSSDVYSRAINNDQYKGLLLTTSTDTAFQNGNLLLCEMTPKNNFEIQISGDWRKQPLLDNFYNYGGAQKMAFSADRTYSITHSVGVTGSGTTRRGLRFQKLNSDGRYAPLTEPLGSSSISYNVDISKDGQFAAGTVAASPWIEAYKRTGDTWSKCNTSTGTAVASGTYDHNQGRMFDQFNVLHTSNNSSDTYKAFQTWQYDEVNNRFTVNASTTGLPAVGASGLDIYDDLVNGVSYYACTDVSTPHMTLYKSTNGVDFTDLSSNITNKPKLQHYKPMWDPTGTYLFVCVNDASHVFGVYKRDGDNLNYLGPSIFDQRPASASPTSRNHTWSLDGKYVMSTAPTTYGSFLYRRIGDNFYLMNTGSIAKMSSTTLFDEYSLRVLGTQNFTPYMFVWLP